MDLNKLKKQLLETKAELEKRVTTIHSHARKPLDANSSEQAAELGNVEVVSALETEAVEELASIEAAMQRLEDGSYGTCITCSEDISEQRLSVRPESLQCVGCAEISSN